MADGAGASSLQKMDSGYWAAQGELARQVTELAKQVGTVVARVEDRVTHKELMGTVAELRKEYAAKAEHMEGKFDQSTAKVEHILDRTVDRIKENLAGLTAKAVDEAMTARKQRENDAMATITSREADIDRRIRASNRLAFGGFGFGAVGIVAAIAQSMWGVGG